MLAQRLLRRLCPECKEPFTPTSEELEEVGINPKDLKGHIFRPRAGGCPECLQTGYRGRTGIYELMSITENVRSLIVRNLSSTEIREAAIADGMVPLRFSGGSKVLAGETSLEEVMRITQDDSVALSDTAGA